MTNTVNSTPDNPNYVKNYIRKSLCNMDFLENTEQISKEIFWSITKGQMVGGFPPAMIERAKIALSLVRRGRWSTPHGYSDLECSSTERPKSSMSPAHAPTRELLNNYIYNNSNNSKELNTASNQQRSLMGLHRAVEDMRRILALKPDSNGYTSEIVMT